MPQIKEYTAPAEFTDITPKDEGGRALERAAQFHEVHAQQMGQTIGQGLSNVGKTGGSQIDAHEEFMDVSNQMKLGATTSMAAHKLYEDARAADPDNPNAGYSALEPIQALWQKNVDAATTKGGRTFAMQQMERGNSQFETQAHADGVIATGSLVAKNWTDTSNTVMANVFQHPDQFNYEAGRDALDANASAMRGKLTDAKQQAGFSKDLEEKQSALATGYVLSAAHLGNDGPNIARRLLQDPALAARVGGNMNVLNAKIDEAEKANVEQGHADEVEQNKKDLQAYHGDLGRLGATLTDPNGNEAVPNGFFMNADKIAETHPNQDPAEAERAKATARAILNRPTNVVTDKPTLDALQAQKYDPSVNPKNLLTKIQQARDANKLSEADYTRNKSEVMAMIKDPQVASAAREQYNDTRNVGLQAAGVSQSGIQSPTSMRPADVPRIQKFDSWYSNEVQRLHSLGKTDDQIFSVGSPDYILSPTNLDRVKRIEGDDVVAPGWSLQGFVKTMTGGAGTTPPTAAAGPAGEAPDARAARLKAILSGGR